MLPETGSNTTRCEKWCVYVLHCRNGSLYTGITNDLTQRLKQHEQGKGSKYVRSWRPFELVRTISCKDAAEARRLEYDLKRLTRKEKIAFLDLGRGKHIGSNLHCSFINKRMVIESLMNKMLNEE